MVLSPGSLSGPDLLVYGGHLLINPFFDSTVSVIKDLQLSFQVKHKHLL